MKTIASVAQMQHAVADLHLAGKRIGFVPTMGALHEGHLSLVKQCKAENDCCVVSIFVNPTQFNDKRDLSNYPRNLSKDEAMLQSAGCDFVFAPTTDEIYADVEIDKPFEFDFNGLDKVMEGKFRPNHFNGVVQIVSKLFSIVLPNKAYFGEKDFQQLAVIKYMTSTMRFDTEIVPCPIVREPLGLAMSSRNELLSTEERKIAQNISKVLFESRNFVNQKSPADIQREVIEQINGIAALQVEYFEIVNGDSLQSIQNWTDAPYIVGCITVFCGKVRLIDNIRYI